jgi:hypothetical protein
MPKAEEIKLRAQARRKGLKGRRANAYVYGTLRKEGWRPRRKRKRRGN